MYKIAVAGTGYVGLVAGVCFAEMGHQVTCVDIDENKVNVMKSGVSPIYEAGLEELMQRNYSAGRIDYTTDYKLAYKDADAIFIGVGTPEQPDGSADLGYIATVARQIAESVEKDCLVVVKSTVPVGTNDKVEQFIQDFLVNDVKVEVASNPEFLAQGSAVHDTLHAARIIIGTESQWAEQILKQIYEPFQIPIVSVNRRSAEMIKYASNDFLALKISYMNDIANLCELVGADIQDVAKGMSYDERIGSKFLNAGIGFGGSCFPKDTKALDYIAKQNGYELKTIKAAIDVNKDQKTILYKKASKRLITFNGLKVAVLGLTFKPGTDDLREAASLENVPLLLEQGADIYAYDPVGKANFSKFYPEGQHIKGSISYVDNIEEALNEANVCFIFTEWGEIKSIDPKTYQKLMRTPLVFDGRNIYNVSDMENVDVEYHSIGRRTSYRRSLRRRKLLNFKTLDTTKVYLVTGAAGFIGYFLSKYLLDQGCIVVGIDNLNDYYDVDLKQTRLSQLSSYSNFTFIKGDISDKTALMVLFEKYKPQVVVNLAAQAGVRYSIENPDAYIQSNVIGFYNILEACRAFPVDHLVYASSSSVYGANKKVPFEETDFVDHPVSLYASTKKTNELMAHTYSHLYKIPATGLRFFTVYGPLGRPDMAYYGFADKYFAGESIKIFNDGDFENDLYRDFTYIDDIVEGIQRLLNNPPEVEVQHRVFNIGNNSPEKLMTFIHALEEALSSALGRKVEFNKIYEPIKPGDVPATYASTDLLQEAIDLKPKTSIQEGLQQFANWYVDYYKLK